MGGGQTIPITRQPRRTPVRPKQKSPGLGLPAVHRHGRRLGRGGQVKERARPLPRAVDHLCVRACVCVCVRTVIDSVGVSVWDARAGLALIYMCMRPFRIRVRACGFAYLL